MSLEKFDYAHFPTGKAPVIPIEVYGEGGWHEVWVYVDSGATTSIFKMTEAERFGFKVSSKKMIMVTVGDGSMIPAYLRRAKIRIGSTVLFATLSFSDHLGVDFNLLGRRDIFDRFTVCFSDNKGILTFSGK